jgi:MoxR-like ATPase
MDIREIHAVNTAIKAGRPLLVRGEPGIGKSQLARAAAKVMGRAYIKHVIDSRTESRDLMWTFDAVQRLADAQLAGALRRDPEQASRALDVQNYLHPGPLWWAFDWEGAERQRNKVGGQPPSNPDAGDWRKGCVLLIDEIDKAESEVPNGLLDALGAREFKPFGYPSAVGLAGRPPLVVITSNEERTLPDAFLRRCVVMNLELPAEEQALVDRLVERGHAHFGMIDDTVLRRAAKMLFDDRQAAIDAQVMPRPGQAEYLDLLRAVHGLAGDDSNRQITMMETVREFTLRKHAARLLSG